MSFFASIFSTDKAYAFPFAPFGIEGGMTYSPWTDSVSGDQVRKWICCPGADDVALTVTFPTDISLPPFSATDVHVLTLKRYLGTIPIPEPDREQHLVKPGIGDEYTGDAGPIDEIDQGPFVWKGRVYYGPNSDDPDYAGPSTYWTELVITAEAHLCDLPEVNGWQSISEEPYPQPQERFQADADEPDVCAPTFRVFIQVAYVDGGIFWIQTPDPQVYIGTTSTGDGTKYGPLDGTANWDGVEFEYHVLDAPSTYLTGIPAFQLDTSKWFTWEGAFGPTYDSLTGLVIPGRDPHTDPVD